MLWGALRYQCWRLQTRKLHILVKGSEPEAELHAVHAE